MQQFPPLEPLRRAGRFAAAPSLDSAQNPRGFWPTPPPPPLRKKTPLPKLARTALKQSSPPRGRVQLSCQLISIVRRREGEEVHLQRPFPAREGPSPRSSDANPNLLRSTASALQQGHPLPSPPGSGASPRTPATHLFAAALAPPPRFLRPSLRFSQLTPAGGARRPSAVALSRISHARLPEPRELLQRR